MADFDVELSVLCDEVRREDTGQYMLIGVFGAGQLGFKNFPATKRELVAYVLGSSKKPRLAIDYRMKQVEGKAVVSEGQIGMQYGGDAEFLESKLDFTIDLSDTEFPEPGEYALQLRVEGQRWKSVAKIELAQQ